MFQPVAGMSGSQVALDRDPSDPTRMFALDINGNLRSFRTSSNSVVTTLSISGSAGGGGGYGLALDPQFAETGHVYIFFPTSPTSSVLRYTRSTTNPDVFDATSRTVILQIPNSPTQHTGGWIGFGPDDLLYVGVGDHFNSSYAQNVAVLMGKLLRVNVRADDFPADANRNYSIPATNPFIGTSSPPEVIARGVRNPFRCAFDFVTGALFVADVGGSSREEVNMFFPANALGQNLGWPCREGFVSGIGTGACATPPVFTDPVIDFTRAQMSCITGGVVYRGNAIPSLRGRFLVGSCAGSARLYSFDPANPISSIRSHAGAATSYSFATDAQGEVYVGLQNGVAKIVPGPAPATDCNANSVLDSCDIAAGAETDFNTNTVPDSCERACAADFNLSGALETADIFEFLNRWFAQALAADFDASGTLEVQDIFGFLNAWFNGCP